MLWMLMLSSAACVVTLSSVLFMCLKIKSSKKDPAFAGLEGTISPLGGGGGGAGKRRSEARRGGRGGGREGCVGGGGGDE